MHKTTTIAAVIAAAAAPLAAASIIDFETTPAGMTPADDAPLSRTTPYAVGGTSVTFGFDTDSDLVADLDALFEARGSDGSDGFVSATGSASDDSEAPGISESLDDWFLRQPDSLGNVPGDFIIDYSVPVTALSGQIWDIDANIPDRIEQWRVSFFDAAGNLISSVDSPAGLDDGDPNTLDSRAWTFTFQNANSPASTVRISNIGNATTIGLAFDNYNATAIPTPASAALAGLAGLTATTRRRR